MTEDEFTDILMKNDEDQLRRCITSFGKKGKPVSPIYFLFDLPTVQKEGVEKEFGIVIERK